MAALRGWDWEQRPAILISFCHSAAGLNLGSPHPGSSVPYQGSRLISLQSTKIHRQKAKLNNGYFYVLLVREMVKALQVLEHGFKTGFGHRPIFQKVFLPCICTIHDYVKYCQILLWVTRTWDEEQIVTIHKISTQGFCTWGYQKETAVFQHCFLNLWLIVQVSKEPREIFQRFTELFFFFF